LKSRGGGTEFKKSHSEQKALLKGGIMRFPSTFHLKTGRGIMYLV